MPDDISSELKQFVEQYIESVPQLEALLLLRNEPQRKWTAAEIAKALYLPEDVAGSLLVDFTRGGFATMVPPAKDVYSYRVRDEAIDRLVGQLQAAYHDRRVAIISLIYSKPLHKVQTFADAFRFGKENPK
jgi:hypothetical protein